MGAEMGDGRWERWEMGAGDGDERWEMGEDDEVR
jgi:hypothetical protein